ncbi:RibD family protein [Lutispora sp.]|uniref:RibD family protein n=1 Tax=Lutispora sp. TaxID=2828727 RepID=UPI000EB914EE|nr:RibD family protein [Lutispora sp.]MEA4963382.1 RibD family protein [Lutispora sp.]HCJ56767.1 riboflavin biosynthesis protein RibD [Clostridiaceae bacterium]
MKPKVIMHTQISLDGCIRGFIDTGIYYTIANQFNADMVLFGSKTVCMAAEQYPPETEKAFIKPADMPEDKRSLWVVPDSRGTLRNLHVFRDSEYCKDFIILASASTPKNYIEYLKERNYDFIIAGDDNVDYAKAFEVLYDKYNCRIIRTDSGGELTNVLIKQGLVDEISLIISPCLVGTNTPQLFRSLSIQDKLELKLIGCETVDDNYVSLNYIIPKD